MTHTEPGAGRATWPDDLLIQRIRDGETPLYAEVFRRYAPRVFRFACLLGIPSSEADDLVQETFLRAFRALPTYQPRGKLVNWMLAITRNLIIDRQRKPTREVPGSPHLERCPAPGTTGPSEPLSDRINLAVLTAPEREVLLLRVVDELPYEDIAEITGYTVGTLRKMVCQALARLREEHGDNALHAV